MDDGLNRRATTKEQGKRKSLLHQHPDGSKANASPCSTWKFNIDVGGSRWSAIKTLFSGRGTVSETASCAQELPGHDEWNKMHFKRFGCLT